MKRVQGHSSSANVFPCVARPGVFEPLRDAVAVFQRCAVGLMTGVPLPPRRGRHEVTSSRQVVGVALRACDAGVRHSRVNCVPEHVSS